MLMKIDLEATTNKQPLHTFQLSPLLFFLVFGSCFFGVSHVFAQTDQTASKLQAANTAINEAFNAVLAAEKAGANVTGLLAQLNVAEADLAEAENSYRSGDSSAAATQADSVLPIAQQVTTAAQNAKQTATVSGQNAFWSTIAFTVIGVFVFVLVCFWFGAGLSDVTLAICLKQNPR